MAGPCYYHPDTPAVDTCVQCGMPICQQCRDRVADKSVCRKCVGAVRARLEQQMASGGPQSAVSPPQNLTGSPAYAAASGNYQSASSAGGSADSQRTLLGIVAAAAISLIGGLIWEKMIFHLGYRIPFLFIGIGVATGYAFHRITGRSGSSAALIASFTMFVCLLLAHLLLAMDLLGVMRASSSFGPSASLSDAISVMTSRLSMWQWVSIAIGLGWCYRAVDQQKG